MSPLVSKRLLKFAAGPVLGLALLVAGCDQIGMTMNDPAISDDRPSSSAAADLARFGAMRADVKIDNFTFDPPTLSVPVGATVTWVNRDDVPHTVTANDKQFASTALDTDDRYSHVFAAPGTYAYFCAVHPHMTGKIIVK